MHQAVSEERLQKSWETGWSRHENTSNRARSKRAAASFKRSGVAERYQVCAAAHTWYLETTPDLLRDIAASVEAFYYGGRP